MFNLFIVLIQKHIQNMLKIVLKIIFMLKIIYLNILRSKNGRLWYNKITKTKIVLYSMDESIKSTKNRTFFL